MSIVDSDIIYNRAEFDGILVSLAIVGSGIGVMVGMVWKDFFSTLLTPARHLKLSETHKWERVIYYFIVAMVCTLVSVFLAYALFTRHKESNLLPTAIAKPV